METMETEYEVQWKLSKFNIHENSGNLLKKCETCM